jgi:tetratricopeptide (TPR) repeat protein
MNTLKIVHEIISRLSEDEKGTIGTYLSLFDQRGKSFSSKSIKLFEMLISSTGKKYTEEELEKMLYDKPNRAAFNRLLLRFKDKLLEALIIDVNINRDGVYSEKSRATVEVRKNITQAQLLQSRGARSLSQLMFEKAIEQSEKYELFEELLLALRLLIDHHNVSYGDKLLNKLLKTYHDYDYSKNAVLRAEVNYGRVNAGIDFRPGQNAKLDWLKMILEETLNDYKKTSSAQVGYYYHYIRAYYFELLGDYRTAGKSLEKILALLNESPAIYTPFRFEGVLLNLANNDIYLREFEQCYEKAEQALPKFKKGSHNYAQGIELMFYAQFYLGEYEPAIDTLKSLLPEDLSVTTDYRLGKRVFLLASAFFASRHFAAANKALNTINPIEDDKEGWNIGIRLLSIMTLIELEKFDEAATKIDALRMFLHSLGKSQEKRIKKIYPLLQNIRYNGFDFRATYLKEKDKIESLETDTGAIAWQLKSPEMIAFHQWFRAKALHQKFVQKIPVYEFNELTAN